MIIYFLTAPFSSLAGLFNDREALAVQNFQNDYGYNQNIGIYGKDYTEGYGQNYDGIIFTENEVDVVYYNQLDERWANKPYGTDKIGTHACGPTSMAIVISSFTNNNVTPVDMANWSYENGYWCKDNGSYHSLIPNAAKSFGLNCEGIRIDQPEKIINALSNGKLVVAIMGKGHFTTSGHFIVLRGITENGKILVADPASRKRSNEEWDLDIFLNEARKGAAAGGPFWAIGT